MWISSLKGEKEQMILLFKFLAAHFHDEISVLLYLLDEEAPPMSYSNKGLVNYFLRITWLKKMLFV